MSKANLFILFLFLLLLTGCKKEQATEWIQEKEELQNFAEDIPNESTMILFKEDHQQIEIKASFKEPQLVKQENGIDIYVPGLEKGFDTYQLPFKSFVLVLPQGQTLDCVSIEESPKNLIENVQLSPKEYLPIGIAAISQVKPDLDTYYYKKEIMSGYQLLYLELRPIRYLAAEEKLYFQTEMDVVITLKKDETIRVLNLEPEEIEDMVDNPEVLETYK